MTRKALLLAWWAILPLFALAERSPQPTDPDTLNPRVERTLLFGVGYNSLYDSYLSPLNYGGPTLSFTRLGERRHGLEGRNTFVTLFDLNGTQATNPSGNGIAWDVEMQFDAGWRRRLTPLRSAWQWSMGALGALHLGGTYNQRNGNNPAQARAAVDVAFSTALRHPFRLMGRRFVWNSQLDVPLVGVMFTPNYGQSYYEIFSLGNTDRNVMPTTPFSAPSLRLLTTLSIPLRRSCITVGYKADIRQSHVHHLERHAWNHTFVIGYSRLVQFPFFQ